MKIALVQIESIDGDIDANIARHMAALETLGKAGAALAVFPELSLSNYEPRIAAAAAIDADDTRLAPLEALARDLELRICVGAALKNGDKPSIAAILISPAEPRRVIHKAYLHADEAPLFAAGSERVSVLPLAQRVAVAICFDISVDAHIEQAAADGMDIYLASVAKTASGIAAARDLLRSRARNYALPVLVVNSVGKCEGLPAGGNSMIIDSGGSIVEALDDREQAILVYDSTLGRAYRLSLDMSSP